MTSIIMLNTKASWRIRVRVWTLAPVTLQKVGPRDLTDDAIKVAFRVLYRDGLLGETVGEASVAAGTILVDPDPTTGWFLIDLPPEARSDHAIQARTNLIGDLYLSKSGGAVEWVKRLNAVLLPGT